jgi:hypothetical protein
VERLVLKWAMVWKSFFDRLWEVAARLAGRREEAIVSGMQCEEVGITKAMNRRARR